MPIYYSESVRPPTARDACLKLLQQLVGPEAAEMLRAYQEGWIEDWVLVQDREELDPRMARVHDIVVAAPGAKGALSCAVARVIERHASQDALQKLAFDALAR